MYIIQTGAWWRRELGDSIAERAQLGWRSGELGWCECKVQGEKSWRAAIDRNHGMMGQGWVGLRAWTVPRAKLLGSNGS